eukprot:gene37144-50107_t
MKMFSPFAYVAPSRVDDPPPPPKTQPAAAADESLAQLRKQMADMQAQLEKLAKKLGIMSSRIDRIRQTIASRKAARFAEARADEAYETTATHLPVTTGPAVSPRGPRGERQGVDAEFAAQLIGQDGERRGLRAGVPLFDRAKNAYNSIEWSGSFDRRARAGRTTRTDI